MSDVRLDQLLEAGVHFGHQTRRWNPKMKPFIFTERNGIHIIDLRKTLDRLKVAQQAVREVVLRGERILFVCTKKQLRTVVEQEAQRSGSYWVTERWLGGMLTNFQTIRQQIRRLKELERGSEENAFEFYTKKERLMLDRERLKLEKYLAGVKDMGRLPGAIFVVDARRESIAVKEASKLGIPVIAITDTNADPDQINYPIPGNDDAIRSVTLIATAMADTIGEARKEVPEDERRRIDELEATTYSTETGETTEKEAPKRRRPRRKRRPRPEVIAAHRKDDEAEAASDSDAEGAEASEADEAPAAVESKKPEAGEETAESATASEDEK
ncbi:MAG: 30S ribosomal protein S2 [Gemmatimonas sp. SG8_23]|jgi:small subunit ribosomal protein S2|nr:MAG: 30S ribosomal protein S2 [Gemmatimonas sp. SG8_23]